MPLTDEAREALEQTGTAALLTAFAALTHQMHEVGRDLGDATALRVQRDAIRDEILRRTGEA